MSGDIAATVMRPGDGGMAFFSMIRLAGAAKRRRSWRCLRVV